MCRRRVYVFTELTVQCPVIPARNLPPFPAVVIGCVSMQVAQTARSNWMGPGQAPCGRGRVGGIADCLFSPPSHDNGWIAMLACLTIFGGQSVFIMWNRRVPSKAAWLELLRKVRGKNHTSGWFLRQGKKDRVYVRNP